LGIPDTLQEDDISDRAMRLMMHAAQQNYSEAQYVLGAAYFHAGDHKAVGINLLQAVANQGHSKTQCTLAVFYLKKKEFIKALPLLQAAADQGFGQAKNILAQIEHKRNRERESFNRRVRIGSGICATAIAGFVLYKFFKK